MAGNTGTHDWNAARLAALAAMAAPDVLQSECNALDGAAAVFEILAGKTATGAGDDGGIRLVHDGLNGCRPAAVKYRIPGLGDVALRYLDDYPSDRAAGILDPDMMDIQTDFENANYASVSLYGWTLKCVPNPDGRDFAGWELDGFLRHMDTIRAAMPELQAAVDRHFPPEARR